MTRPLRMPREKERMEDYFLVGQALEIIFFRECISVWLLQYSIVQPFLEVGNPLSKSCKEKKSRGLSKSCIDLTYESESALFHQNEESPVEKFPDAKTASKELGLAPLCRAEPESQLSSFLNRHFFSQSVFRTRRQTSVPPFITHSS